MDDVLHIWICDSILQVRTWGCTSSFTQWSGIWMRCQIFTCRTVLFKGLLQTLWQVAFTRMRKWSTKWLFHVTDGHYYYCHGSQRHKSCWSLFRCVWINAEQFSKYQNSSNCFGILGHSYSCFACLAASKFASSFLLIAFGLTSLWEEFGKLCQRSVDRSAH